MKKRTIILLSVLAVVFVAGVIALGIYAKKQLNTKTETSGVIYFSLYDKSDAKTIQTDENGNVYNVSFTGPDGNNSLVETKTLEFKEGETLVQILERYYTLRLSGKSEQGRTIEGINDHIFPFYKTDPDYCNYVYLFWINGKFSNYGIDSVPVTDGMHLTFAACNLDYFWLE